MVTEAILYEGDAGYAPRGSAHYFVNIGNTDAYVILIFDGGQFTNMDVTSLIANVPPQASGAARSEGHIVPYTLQIGCAAPCCVQMHCGRHCMQS